MKKIVYSLLFIGSIAFSQTEKKVGDFNKVTSFDKIDVLLIPSSENNIILNGSGSENVELVIKNGELKLKMPLSKIMSGDNVSATVYYKKIDAVEANEGSRIASEVVFKTTAFDIIAKEGSVVKLKIDCDRLAIKASDGSKVTLEGKVKNQEILVSTGGVYAAEKLISNQSIITVNTGGKATIYATDFVDAKVIAGGKIYIYGKPKQINEKKIAGGKIEEVK